MAMTFVQNDDADVCNASAGNQCSGLAGTGWSGDCNAAVGATAGTGTETLDLAGSATDNACFLFDLPVAAGVTWGAGDWTVRVNITGSNMNLTIVSCYICRINSSCANQETIGSATGLSISLGTTGVKTITVTGSAVTPSANDRVGIIIGATNGAMTSQTATMTRNQNIDSPFSPAFIAKKPYTVSQSVKRASVY